MPGYRFRIAPTPSGFLHTGNAFNFILTALLAQGNSESLRLRIDDVDAPRARREYLEDIFETLHWLGIQWDEGPRDADDHASRFSQGLRAERYDHTLQTLIATGQVFACECSRKDIVSASDDGQYPGTCRDKELPFDMPDTALRLRTPQDSTVDLADVLLGSQTLSPHTLARDPVIRRRDGIPAYHVVSITDDLDFGITHIVRGEDLLGTTAVQLFISQLLKKPAFERVAFYHHPLLKNTGGEKLSKSAGSSSLRAMREDGLPASEMYQRFSAWMGWSEVAADIRQAAELFGQNGFQLLKESSSRDAAG